MKEYDIKITEVLEKTVQVQAESREEAEAIASEETTFSSKSSFTSMETLPFFCSSFASATFSFA